MLSSDALELFNSQSEEGDKNLGGFSTWPEAVQFFLRTYAKDQYIEESVESIEKISQETAEELMEFFRPLTKNSRDVERVVSEDKSMSRLQFGLHADILPIFRDFRNNFTGSKALADSAEHASAIIAYQRR